MEQKNGKYNLDVKYTRVKYIINLLKNKSPIKPFLFYYI